MSSLRFLMPRSYRSVPTPLRCRAGLHAQPALHSIRLKPRNQTNPVRSNSSTSRESAAPKQSLTGRLRDLSKKYGKAAIFVYFGISLVDFGIAFAAVHALGTERIGHYEDALFRKIKDLTGYKKTTANQVTQAAEDVADSTDPNAGPLRGSLWTEVVIAYGIHKAIFIFARIPITVAITPSIVKALIKRGYKIGPAAVQSTKSIH